MADLYDLSLLAWLGVADESGNDMVWGGSKTAPALFSEGAITRAGNGG